MQNGAFRLATQGETHNANLFAYCNNNPVNRADYTGRYSEKLEYDLLGLSLWVASLSVTYKILARIEGYRDYLEYDVYSFTYRIIDDKFIIFDRCPYIITNIAFSDSQNKKYYVIKTVISDMSYWYQREHNVNETVNDSLNKHARVFVEGSLMEIIDDYDDVSVGEGIRNLVGDGINYGISRALIEVMYPMPLQFRSIYNRNRGASLIVGLTKSAARLKSSVYVYMLDLSLPSIYDDVEAIY